MNGKARYIFPVVVTAIIVFMVTLIVTVTNLGFPTDFLRQWGKAYLIAWPVAAVTAFFAVPAAQRITGSIVTALDGDSDSRKN